MPTKKEEKPVEKKVEKKPKKKDTGLEYTDILEEYYFEGIQEMVKRTYQKDGKEVKTEITNHN